MVIEIILFFESQYAFCNDSFVFFSDKIIILHCFIGIIVVMDFKTDFMIKKLLFLLLFFTIFSCIPIRIAPNIKDDKVMLAKKFKRKLPKDYYAFIFEDPKDADEFYNFINAKFGLGFQDVEYNVPFFVEGQVFFLSFHEVEIPTKTINLLPMIIDAKLEDSGNDSILEEYYISRNALWYLAITVTDKNMEDCLKPKHPARAQTINYLRALQKEYLNTSNYAAAYFRK